MCIPSIAPRTCGILQPVKSQKLLIFAPVSKVVFGNLINSGDIRTSSEISSLTNSITVDFPIPNTLLIVRNEFPVESLHNATNGIQQVLPSGKQYLPQPYFAPQGQLYIQKLVETFEIPFARVRNKYRYDDSSTFCQNTTARIPQSLSFLGG